MARTSKTDTIKLQSLGEAHLYVSIAKIDGIVSKNEKVFTGVYAIKSQKLYDVLKINSKIAKRVHNDIHSILNNSRFHSWNTADHYNEAIRLLKQAKSEGNWSVNLSSIKHENGLLQVAMLDEYTFAESEAVKDTLRRLEQDLK